MLSSQWLTVSISIILGFLSGLGTGGGSLLLIWLTVVMGMDPLQARSINLMFYIPSALVSTIFHTKRKKIDFKILFPGILAGCIGALITASLSINMDLSLLKKLFGGLLIMIGLKEIFDKKKAGQ